MTWNIEGLRRNIFNLKYFIEQQQHTPGNKLQAPDLILLSEPQIFATDIDLVLTHLRGEYSWFLNSEDKHDPELPMVKSRAHGGTLV